MTQSKFPRFSKRIDWYVFQLSIIVQKTFIWTVFYGWICIILQFVFLWRSTLIDPPVGYVSRISRLTLYEFWQQYLRWSYRLEHDLPLILNNEVGCVIHLPPSHDIPPTFVPEVSKGKGKQVRSTYACSITITACVITAPIMKFGKMETHGL